MSLLGALRARTRDLHKCAERTGVIRDLLGGRASRQSYALFLRNLAPVYAELERGLERHADVPLVAVMARPELYRSAALADDLKVLAGGADNVPLLRSGRRFGEHIVRLAERDGRGLVGHAYVRYLGDLSGGRILKRILERKRGIEPSALGFYAFPRIPDIDQFKAELRLALDRAAEEAGDHEVVVGEAVRSFELAIELSLEVQAATEVAAGHEPTDRIRLGAGGPKGHLPDGASSGT